MNPMVDHQGLMFKWPPFFDLPYHNMFLSGSFTLHDFQLVTMIFHNSHTYILFLSIMHRLDVSLR